MRFLKWFLWVVIAAFVVLFGNDWSGVGQGDRARVAAFVGGDEVTTEEVRETYQQIEDYYRQIFGERYNSDLAQQLNLVGQALQATVERTILLREAQDLGLMTTDQELREQILSYPTFKDESGRFVGTEAYRSWVRRAGFASTDAFEARLREDLLRSKLDTILSQTIYVSDRELEAVYREQAEKAKIRYLLLPGANFADVEVDPARLEAFFAENQERYRLPERRVVDYVLIDLIKMRQGLDIPEAELRAYYDDHLDEFVQEEQVRARHILLQVTPERDAEQAESALRDLRQRLESGEDFATLAREHSDEPDSAQRGGNLGFFGRNAWGEDFNEIVFGAEPGSLIGPVKTQYGYHLIEVQERRAGGAQPFESVAPRIRNRLVSERADQLAEAKARELAAQLTGSMPAEAFRAAVTEAGFEVTTTEPFGAADVVPGIGPGAFPETAFELAADGVSEPVKVPRGWTILRLDRVETPRLPTLAEVEDRIRPLVRAQAQKDAAMAALEEARARLDAGTALEDLAAELGVEVQESEEFGAGGTISGLGQNPRLANAALALTAGDYGGPIEAGPGAVLFQVAERKTFDPVAFEAAKEETRQTEEAQRLSKLRAALVAQRTKDLDVRYNPEALALLGVDAEFLGQDT